MVAAPAARFEEALAAFRASGQPGVPLVLGELGWFAYERGDLDEARATFAESLCVAGASGNLLLPAFGLSGLAAVAARWGEPVLAARLLGAAVAVLGGREAAAYGVSAPIPAIAAVVRAERGANAYAAASAEGRALALDAAVALALAQTEGTRSDD